ncbi:Pimeloyl-ACP methyl ester carboxylesterase [Dyadobacter koreensis]|uniref:Pimeloyl-ACP methyl ester carboxylesterase n=1 Tax=Dyadobacter koreensis TaxID=408657 RepID=A0A1H6QBS3_9BACT|nr:alpha/beta fold hydrolase [Dyadobacter koreensis]SEI37637.1 Pimeloyl-ACP methyl ester carboxylesterase [Dyadobacter koreensis]
MKFKYTLLLVFASCSCCLSQASFLKSHPQLAYWKLGNHSDVLIVLHGGPGVDHQYLRPELDGLDKFATVIYYDQRGCGKSERADSYTWQDHVEDLRRIIHTLSPKKKIFLAGSSWGSLLAILYSYTYPDAVKGLILSGTVRWPGQGIPFTRQGEVKYKIPRTQLMHEKSLVKNSGADGATRMDTISISKLVEVQSGAPNTETMMSLISAPISDSLSRIRMPIILFNGPMSRKFDWVDHYLALFPAAELHTFEVAGHDPWFSDPKRFAQTCGDFIFKHR